jgi:hypothetical protein
MSLLDQLRTAGGVSAGDVVARQVEWNGHVFDFHFLDLPGGKVQKLLKENDVDPAIVAASLVEPDGKPALTMDQVLSLKLGLRAAIVRAAMDVWGFSPRAREEEKKD